MGNVVDFISSGLYGRWKHLGADWSELTAMEAALSSASNEVQTAVLQAVQQKSDHELLDFLNTQRSVNAVTGLLPPNWKDTKVSNAQQFNVIPASINSATEQFSNPGSPWVDVIVDITSLVGTANLTVVINGVGPSGEIWALLDPVELTASGINTYRIGRSATPSANLVANEDPPPLIEVICTVGGVRFDTATVTDGSDIVLDASIGSGDNGKIVTGTGIPASTYVGTVTAGTSFLLSSSNSSQVNVNANNNGTQVVIGGGISYLVDAVLGG